jgi:hypothetical protein
MSHGQSSFNPFLNPSGAVRKPSGIFFGRSAHV